MPERRCLGCGTRAPKRDLARFVAVPRDGVLVVTRDLSGTMPGRGLYTCPSPKCVQRAAERGGFARGARASVAVVDDLAAEFVDGEAVSGA